MEIETKQYAAVLKGDDVKNMDTILSVRGRTFAGMVREWIKQEVRIIARGF